MARVILAGIDIALDVFSLATDEDVGALYEDLTADERARVARLVPDRQRRRAIASRARLRRALGARLGCPPHAVPLTRAAHGKPHLADAATSLRFNMAHCGDVAVLAIGSGAEIGIDIEACREVDPAVGRAILSPRERAASALDAPWERSAHLLRRWTMKEAAVKAAGCGFQGRPAGLDLGDWRGDGPVSVAAEPLGCSGTLIVRALHDLQPGHVAALAVLAEGSVQ